MKSVIKAFAITIALIIACFLLFISYYLYNIFVQNSYVASIDGEKISVKEFNQRVNSDRSDIYSYFKSKYSVDDSTKFWTANYNGEVPAEKVKRAALEECKKIKAQQILAKKKGIVSDITYDKFLKDMKAENARRNTAVSRGQIIYGPINYDENTYFTDSFSKMVISLKEKLVEDGDIKFNDNDLKEYYNSIKDKLYTVNESVTIERVFISYISDKGVVDEVKKKETYSKIKGIQKKLINGSSFETFAKIYNPDEDFQKSFGAQEFNDSTQKNESQGDYILRQKAMNLQEGEVSPEIIDADNCYNLIKCIKRTDKKYKTFDEVKDNVRMKYIDKKYDELIEKLLENSKLVMNNSIYNSIKVK